MIAKIQKISALAILQHAETKAYLVTPELIESFVRLAEEEDIQEREQEVDDAC